LLIPVALAMMVSLRFRPPKPATEEIWKIVLPLIALSGVVAATLYAWL
jgi:hypothetical protein